MYQNPEPVPDPVLTPPEPVPDPVLPPPEPLVGTGVGVGPAPLPLPDVGVGVGGTGVAVGVLPPPKPELVSSVQYHVSDVLYGALTVQSIFMLELGENVFVNL